MTATRVRRNVRVGSPRALYRRDGHVGRRGLLRLVAASLVLAPLAITAPASSRELTPIPVKTADPPVYLFSPAADGTWFGWARYDRSRRSQNYFVQRGTTARLRVNPKGTSAEGGGIYRHTLVYTQSRGDAPSDLYRFNLRTGRRAPFPDLVNTPWYESNPTLSGRYLLFDRLRTKERSETFVNKIMLYDRTTRTLRVLAKTEFPLEFECPPYVQAGQVNGAYAVWESGYNCYPPRIGHVVLYDLRRDTRTPFPRPRNTSISHQSSAVSSDGTVYFVRQNNTFEDTQRIVKKPLGAPAEVLYTVPSNQYASDLYVDDRARAHHVYFSSPDGIYKLIDPLRSPPGR